MYAIIQILFFFWPKAGHFSNYKLYNAVSYTNFPLKPPQYYEKNSFKSESFLQKRVGHYFSLKCAGTLHKNFPITMTPSPHIHLPTTVRSFQHRDLVFGYSALTLHMTILTSHFTTLTSLMTTLTSYINSHELTYNYLEFHYYSSDLIYYSSLHI